MTDESMDFGALSVEDEPEFIKPNHTADKDKSDYALPWYAKKGKESSGSTRRTREHKTTPPYKPGKYVDALEQIYVGVATIAMPFDMQCASVIMQPVDESGKTRARYCAETLDAAAEKNEGLRRFLEMLITGGTWGAVFIAHAPIMLAVLSHHTPFANRAQAFMFEQMTKNMGADNG